MTGKEKTTDNQDAAVIALLTEPTVAGAAQRAGVSERTLYRWLADPSFFEQYRSARRQAYGLAIGRLQQSASRAVDTLDSVMTDSNSPHHARTSAAVSILRFGRDGIELDDLSERVHKMEQLMEERP